MKPLPRRSGSPRYAPASRALRSRDEVVDERGTDGSELRQLAEARHRIVEVQGGEGALSGGPRPGSGLLGRHGPRPVGAPVSRPNTAAARGRTASPSGSADGPPTARPQHRQGTGRRARERRTCPTSRLGCPPGRGASFSAPPTARRPGVQHPAVLEVVLVEHDSRAGARVGHVGLQAQQVDGSGRPSWPASAATGRGRCRSCRPDRPAAEPGAERPSRRVGTMEPSSTPARTASPPTRSAAWDPLPLIARAVVRLPAESLRRWSAHSSRAKPEAGATIAVSPTLPVTVLTGTE